MGTFFLSPQKHVPSPRVSPFDHRLDWVWIGLVWKIQHEVLLQKTVIIPFDRVSMRSLVVVEEIYIVFRTRLLQFSIFQLLECNRLEVFLEE